MLPADTAPEPVPHHVWEAAIAATPPVATPVPPGARLLVVAAHPDDETIGAGRLIASHDGPVQCVTLTAGERCVGDAEEGNAVAEERLAEWRCALRELGAEPLETQRWPDGELADHVREASAALAAEAAGADAILAPWEHDPHPDHEAAARIAARLADAAGVPLIHYLVWTPYWLTPAEAAAGGDRLIRIQTDDASERAREAALACFPSQTRPRPPARAAVVPASLLERHAEQLLMEVQVRALP
ncbi:MAG: PIG-L family deacetylase [bacterium]|nr:PIG-L family deacetylase [bacterium]